MCDQTVNERTSRLLTCCLASAHSSAIEGGTCAIGSLCLKGKELGSPEGVVVCVFKVPDTFVCENTGNFRDELISCLQIIGEKGGSNDEIGENEDYNVNFHSNGYEMNYHPRRF